MTPSYSFMHIHQPCHTSTSLSGANFMHAVYNNNMLCIISLVCEAAIGPVDHV